MLEGLAAWVLNTYIGEYVENLNTDQLSIGILQGEVELENLPLKKDALNNLGLPLQIVSGFIGRIKLQIPLSRMKSQPWVISIEKLYLVAAPLGREEYDEKKEKAAENARKQSQLKALEDKWKSKTGLLGGGGGSWWSLGSSVATNIIENIQLVVNDVHLRYEDNTTIAGASYACGVVIKSLSAQSTDASWVPQFVSHYNADMMHKLLDLKGFSIYWDDHSEMLGDLPMDRLNDALQRDMIICSKTGDFKDHSYILSPVSAEARMKRNTSPLPLRTHTQPRLQFDIKLDQIPCSLSDTQYRHITELLREFSRYNKACQYRKWRPNKPIKGHARLWWQFAIQAKLHHIKERNDRCTKAYCVQRVVDVVQYVEAYSHALVTDPYYLDPFLKTVIEEKEEQWGFEELKILREVAMNRVEQQLLDESASPDTDHPTVSQQPATSTTSPSPHPTLSHVDDGSGGVGSPRASNERGGYLRGWFPGWGGWGGWYGSAAPGEGGGGGPGPPLPEAQQHPEDQLARHIQELGRERAHSGSYYSEIDEEEEGEGSSSDHLSSSPVSEEEANIEKELRDVLADTAENNTLLRRDVVFAQLNFSLRSGTFTLLTDTVCLKKPMLELECTAINMSFQSRPRYNALKFAISMGGLYLRDKMTENSILPVLIQPQSKERTAAPTLAAPRNLLGGMLGGGSMLSYASLGGTSSGSGSAYLGGLPHTASQGSSAAGGSSKVGTATTEESSSLFELVYEKKPPHSLADNRLEIKTKPLDMVYNKDAIERVTQFFTVKSTSKLHRQELEIAAAAKMRYEELKQQTQAELKQTLGDLLEGQNTIKAKRWHLDLEIASPKFVIPQNCSDERSVQVVIDLGRLQLHNACNMNISTSKDSNNDDEEDFVTPSSTPPNELEEEMREPDLLTNLNEAAIHDKIYDKYTLKLSDVQLMVGRAKKDNWKSAHNKGTSHLHVVDKFTVAMQFERRLIFASDPHLPKAMLSGTLPSLVLHFSEPKVQALRTCLSMLSFGSKADDDSDMSVPTKHPNVYRSRSPLSTKSISSIPDVLDNAEHTDSHSNKPPTTKTADHPHKKPPDCRQLVVNFAVNHVSLEVQSRERSLAELQVSGVRAHFIKRPLDTSTCLTIHSLLIVDAVQTFGPDFELLVASHKNLCLDSRSGSIRDSDPNSPLSPQSPQSPSSPMEGDPPPKGARPASFMAVGQAVTSALQGLVTPNKPLVDLPSPTSPVSASTPLSYSAVMEDALIRVDLDTVQASEEGEADLRVANVQFNNLDVVANQQTVMELLAFFKQIFPSDSSKARASTKAAAHSQHQQAAYGGSVDEDMERALHTQKSNNSRLEVTADFHRLNVLLMTVVETEYGYRGRKVATATLSQARVQATLADDLEVDGSLDGLQLVDLTPGGVHNQKVCLIGIDPDQSHTIRQSRAPPTQQDVYTGIPQQLIDQGDEERALTFSLIKKSSHMTPALSPIQSPLPLHLSHIYSSPLAALSCSQPKDVMSIKLRMASMFYIHSPAFLRDLSECFDDFKDYASKVGNSLKNAATEMALGWVHNKKSADTSAVSAAAACNDNSVSLLDASDASQGRRQFSGHDDSFDFYGSMGSVLIPQPEPKLDVRIDADLKTPVIVLPRAPNCNDVLVFHLGRIILQNQLDPDSMSSHLRTDHAMHHLYTRCKNSAANTTTAAASSAARDAADAAPADYIHMEIRDMALYSSDMKTVMHASKLGSRTGRPVLDSPQEQDSLTYLSTPIMYDTAMELILHKTHVDDTHNGDTTVLQDDKEDNLSYDTLLDVQGRIITPLKLVLSKQTYEQILATLDNITPADAPKASAPSSPVADVDISLFSTTSTLVPDMSTVSSTGHEDAENGCTVEPGGEAVGEQHPQQQLGVNARFHMPVLSVQMIQDLSDKGQGFLNLILEEFNVEYSKVDGFAKNIDISLQSLVIEDLLQDPMSKHKYLVVSRAATHPYAQGAGGPGDVMSSRIRASSCPTSMIELPQTELPNSLPSSFTTPGPPLYMSTDRANHKDTQHQHQHQYMDKDFESFLRKTSKESYDAERLVHIKVQLVDKKSQDFTTKYNSTHRFVDVDLNCLNTTMNLETWVVLLDFLGLGAKVYNVEDYTQKALGKQAQDTETEHEVTESVNTKVSVKVQSLSLLLNKNEYELAEACVRDVTATVNLRDGNFAICGSLGKLSLIDQSPCGYMYRDRFITTGEQALMFDVYKFGTPDPDLLRPYDMSFKLTMSSVCYVHTNHFLQEVIGFIEQFLQLQDFMGRMRAASAGKQISSDAFRSSRISLDIRAGAPIILVPHSWNSNDILVMDMGKLTVHNSFKLAESQGTISYKDQTKRRQESAATATASPSSAPETGNSRSRDECVGREADGDDAMTRSVYGSLEQDLRNEEVLCTQLTDSLSVYRSESWTKDIDPDTHCCLLDVMMVKLIDMDLYSAQYATLDSNQREPLHATHPHIRFSTYLVSRKGGKLLKEKCRLELQIERNLEGQLSHTSPDFRVDGTLSSVHCSLDVNQYKLIKGLLDHNLGEPLPEFHKSMNSNTQDPKTQPVLSDKKWRTIMISIALHNVTLELLYAHAQSNMEEVSMARLDFINSKFVFESYSDDSKDVDLVSHGIRAYDTRYKDAPANNKPNVFTSILQSSRDHSNPNALQLELHYRSTKHNTCFTILLNNMRLMGIFDWLINVKEFLVTKPEDPFHKDEVKSPGGTVVVTSARRSSGIITKRESIPEKPDNPLEIKLNVTDTELVVVEDASLRDTNAVIIKSTAVLNHRPANKKRPLTCNLTSLEVFSCSLGAEDDTALSIIDPMVISIELTTPPINTRAPYMAKSSATSSSAKTAAGATAATTDKLRSPYVEVGSGISVAKPVGLLDAMVESDILPTIEVSFATLNIRLSYNDIRLFMSILNSLPQQALQAQNHSQPRNATKPNFSLSVLQKLENLGFVTLDCEQALLQCDGNLERAASWLLENAPAKQVHGGNDARAATATETTEDSDEEGMSVAALDIRTENVCICLIDDCLDTDVPLLEFTLMDVHFHQKMDAMHSGLIKFKLAADYYNRIYSGWEPFIEPWRTSVDWVPSQEKDNRVKITLQAVHVLNANITKTLITLLDETRKKWTEDYLSSTSEGTSSSSVQHRRTPFIPYSILNETGCTLRFATVITTPDRIQGSGFTSSSSSGSSADNGATSGQHEISEYRTVQPGDRLPFLYDEHEKMRHKHTHELKVHQIIVQVEGWHKTTPISVDRVGVYFREVEVRRDPVYVGQRPARIVFDITKEGTACKLITVRSALILNNALDQDIEIQIERPYNMHEHLYRTIPSHGQQAIPLRCVASRLYMRPKDWSLDWCDKPIQWHHVTNPGQKTGALGHCNTIGTEDIAFRFCVSVIRDNFPLEPTSPSGSSTPPLIAAGRQGSLFAQPGHVITLLPPVRIVNLLPADLKYNIPKLHINGVIKPSCTAPVYGVDLSQSWVLSVLLENYPRCVDITIIQDVTEYVGPLKLYDAQGRELNLRINVQPDSGGSIKISLSAQYWLINKTGLPLVFRQDGASVDSSGQFEEHERARDIAPLIFSYPETETGGSMYCVMRIGKQYAANMNLRPHWSHRFSLEKRTDVRKLNLSTAHEQRPNIVYLIGVESTTGRGRYRDTTIVTFAPRYMLDNRSSRRLTFSQKHFTSPLHSNQSEHLTALPNSKLPFHWPRVDLDGLLCVKFKDDQHCLWSGGFAIDRIASFHINMRTRERCSQFLVADIVLQGPTYFVIFSDAHSIPPPYRIDNLSPVPLTYYQTQTSDTKLRTVIKPHSSLPYAFDEPTLKSHITLSVQGGSTATYSLDSVRDGETLYYKNFIYITFPATFKDSPYSKNVEATPISSASSSADAVCCDERLVLEVMPGHDIKLRKLAPGNRAQLWFMTASGMLQHEGSGVPSDVRYTSSSSATTTQDNHNRYVLDMLDIALQPDKVTPLTLRKADPRRTSTQTWRFEKDGRLCCGSTQMCIQIDTAFGFHEGASVMLGPGPYEQRGPIPLPMTGQRAVPRPTLNTQPAPPHMLVATHKMLPGSGMLAVRVVTDGPTRVLQVADIQHKPVGGSASYRGKENWTIIERKVPPSSPSHHSTTPTTASISSGPQIQQESRKEIELSVQLPEGVGISVISDKYEELLYITLKHIGLHYTHIPSGQILDLSISNIQVDNQVSGSYRPVLVYVTLPAKSEAIDTSPALKVTAHRVPNQSWNAHVFKYFTVDTHSLSIQMEELVLWKLVEFLGVDHTDKHGAEDDSYDSQTNLTVESSTKEKRFYFGSIKLVTRRITLSMFTSTLPPELLMLKKSFGYPLVKFENVKVELDPYSKQHNFETMALLMNSISSHYTAELTYQAAKILGSIDFLGNPLGLVSDVTEGISGLLVEGNVGGFVTNITHGVSNSAAKVVGTLSDGVGILTVDQKHERIRQQIRGESDPSGAGHIAAGIRGLTHGVTGGAKSLFVQTYYGAKEDGFEGLVTGLGKGLMGTFTKPLVGVLDLASEAASAVRDTSKTSALRCPPKARLPRSCYGPRGLLPTYSEYHARGQQLLYALNHHDYDDRYITQEQLREDGDDSLAVVISTKTVYFVGNSKNTTSSDNIVLKVLFSELTRCSAVPMEKKHYIELTTRPAHKTDEEKKPLVRCEHENIAQKVTQQINYAKNLHNERQQTLISLIDSTDE